MKNPTIWAALFLIAVVSGAGAYFYFHNQEVEAATLAGTVSYRERVALAPGSSVSVVLTDTEGVVIAATSYETEGENVPLPFVLTYEPEAILETESYYVSAEIFGSNQVWKTEEGTQVFIEGVDAHALQLWVTQEQEGTPAAHSSPTPSLEGTSWEWHRTEFMTQEDMTAPLGRFVLTFAADGTLQSTTDCNAAFGTYISDGEVLSIGQLGSTLMGCMGETYEQEYLQQLSQVASYSINGTELRLNLLKDWGVMVFEKK